MKVTIVGGGIIGLTSAYYLQKAGLSVEIIERGEGERGCSFGNAGYISPSHFIPLASPGIISEGIRYMMNSRSPFYIKPRLDLGLIKWGIEFWKSSSAEKSHKNALELHKLLQLSRKKSIELAEEHDNPFALEQKGCMMMYRKESTAHHEEEMAKEANALGIKTTAFDKKQLKDAEPLISDAVLGGVLYDEDCHIDPALYMTFMQDLLIKNGVKIHYNEEVVRIVKNGDKVTSVITKNKKYDFDQLLVATGAWLPVLTKDLGFSLLLEAGKGYSTTIDKPENTLKRPAILVDDRIALTPLGKKIRIGGTMEIAGINDKINMSRVEGIIDAVNHNMALYVNVPASEKVWYGLRPCSPDGLPYIGNVSSYSNLFFAGGHAMLGVTLAAGTGYTLAQLMQNSQADIDMNPFRIDRF